MTISERYPAICLGGLSNILLKLGSVFSRTNSFCLFLKLDILLAFGLGICEGVGEDSGHGIVYVDIRVGSYNFLDVIVCHDMCT